MTKNDYDKIKMQLWCDTYLTYIDKGRSNALASMEADQAVDNLERRVKKTTYTRGPKDV